jgi:hypothetical protein
VHKRRDRCERWLNGASREDHIHSSQSPMSAIDIAFSSSAHLGSHDSTSSLCRGASCVGRGVAASICLIGPPKCCGSCHEDVLCTVSADRLLHSAAFCLTPKRKRGREASRVIVVCLCIHQLEANRLGHTCSASAPAKGLLCIYHFPPSRPQQVLSY